MMFNSKVNIENNTVKSIFLGGGIFGKTMEKIFLGNIWKNYGKNIFGEYLEKLWKIFLFITETIFSFSFYFESHCMH